MTHSESIKELAAALAKAQGALAGAKKDTANPFFKSKYADLASIVEALKACFPAQGLSYVQGIVTGDHGVGVETILMHASGEWIKGDPFYLPVNKADAQGFGSCATYARRYSLAAISGVAPEDDDGNAATAAKPKIGQLDNKILPAAIPANQPAHDAFAELPPAAQQVVRDWALEIIADVHAGNVGRANAMADEKCQTQEDKLALWSQLPSDVRSKMKAAKRAGELASQP